MKGKKSGFFSNIISDIAFFISYFKERGNNDKWSLFVSENYTERELLNLLLFNIGCLALNLEIVGVLAYMFYSMQGLFFVLLNCIFAVGVLLSTVDTICNIIICNSFYRLKVVENQKQKNKID